MTSALSAAEEAEPDHAASDDTESNNPLTLSWILGHPLVGAAAVSSAGAGLVHAAAAGTHSGERVASILFAVTSALQVAWAFYYLAHPTRRPAILGMLLNGSFAAMWIVSRTVGLPVPEALAGVEHVSVQDGIAAMLGLSAAVCAAVAAWRAESVRQHRAGSIVAASVISLSVVVLVVAGVSATHGHGGMAGMNMAAPSAGAPTTTMNHAGMSMGSAPGSSMGSMPGMDMGNMPGMNMGPTNNSPQSMGSITMSLNPTDVGFAQGMIIRRHQQVRMADIALVNTTNPDTLALATFIKADATPEIYQLSDALRAGNHTIPDPTVVIGGTTPAPGGMMTNGLATDADFVKLENAFGETFDKVFLELMMRQQDGGITMAGQVFAAGGHATTRNVARESIVDAAAQRKTLELISLGGADESE